MRIEFNTRRPYAADGQRIVAELLADCVVFYDTARGFGDTIALPKYGMLSDAYSIQSHVMREYDHNRYTSTDADRAFVRSLQS